MSTQSKDFKVKNGLVVANGGTFGGPVVVGTPTLDAHAATKAYVDANSGGGPSVTYTTSSTSATGGANIALTGSDSSVDNLKIASTENLTVSSTDSSTISIALNSDIVNINSATLDTTPGNLPTTQGSIYWDTTNLTAALNVDSSVTLQIGQEMLAYVYNAETDTLLDGEVVYLYGAHGNRASVKRASNTAESTSSKTVGVVTEQIASGQNGFITIIGVVNGLDLSGFAEGDSVWLGATPGTFTATKPMAPAHQVFIGVVAKANSGNGALFVRPQNGYELDELHNVLITTPGNDNILAYDSASGLWINQTAAQAGLATATHSHAISDVTGLQTALDAKAPIESPTFTGTVSGITATMVGLGNVTNESKSTMFTSPAFTGTPTAPTATAGTNTTQIATTAFVSSAVSNLVASAPAALDTLNELATALGNDPNFATTITNALAGKQPLDADLTAIAALAGTSGLLKKTGADTWTLDTSTYLTENQSITVSGDASGSGSTSISLTLANSGVSAGTYKSVTVDAKGRVTAGTNPTTLSGYGITDAMPATSSLVAYSSGTGITINDTVSSYVNNIVNITSTTGAITVTLNDSTYPVGTQINFLRNTAQTVTFANGTATVYATPGLKMRAQYSMATLLKVTDGSGSGDVWILTGDLTA